MLTLLKIMHVPVGSKVLNWLLLDVICSEGFLETLAGLENACDARGPQVRIQVDGSLQVVHVLQ